MESLKKFHAIYKLRTLLFAGTTAKEIAKESFLEEIVPDSRIKGFYE